MVAMAAAPWALMGQDWASRAGQAMPTNSERYNRTPDSVPGTSSPHVSSHSFTTASDVGSVCVCKVGMCVRWVVCVIWECVWGEGEEEKGGEGGGREGGGGRGRSCSIMMYLA